MLKISIIISLIVTTLIGLSFCNQEKCDVTKFKPIRNFNVSMLEGNRYLLYRYRNGYERKTKCQTCLFTKKEDGYLWAVITDYWKNGTITTPEQSIIVTDPTSDKGKVVLISLDPIVVLYVVYTDYKNFIFFSACIDGEEYLYIDSLQQYPTEKVLNAINKGIRKLNLDKYKITKTCDEDI